MSALKQNGNRFKWIIPYKGKTGIITYMSVSSLTVSNFYIFSSSEKSRYSSLSEFLTIQKNTHGSDLDIQIVDRKSEGPTAKDKESDLGKILIELSAEADKRSASFSQNLLASNTTAPLNITEYRNATGEQVNEIILAIDDTSFFLKSMDFKNEYKNENTTANLLYKAIRSWKSLGMHVILSFSEANKECLPEEIYDSTEGNLIFKISDPEKKYLASLGLNLSWHNPTEFYGGQGVYCDKFNSLRVRFSKQFGHFRPVRYQCYCPSLELFRFGCKCGGV